MIHPHIVQSGEKTAVRRSRDNKGARNMPQLTSSFDLRNGTVFELGIIGGQNVRRIVGQVPVTLRSRRNQNFSKGFIPPEENMSLAG